MVSAVTRVEKALNLPSPLQTISINNVEVLIKRDDLIHASISGNKWRKLKCHLEVMERGEFEIMITSGGAFSNHLVAVAAVGKLTGLKTVGLVTHYKIDTENPVLKDCMSNGMELIAIGR